MAVCHLSKYFAAVSVAVSAFTLVSISLERYFAICHPLRSRSWQTLSHAYKTIAVVWLLALAVTFPIAVVTKHIPWGPRRHKCREFWPRDTPGELIFSLFLDVALFVLPLLLMLTAYTLISRTLWKGIKMEEFDIRVEQTRKTGHVMRKSQLNTEKNLNAKRRVIKMLFVVVLEFFICWGPLYCTYTWGVVDPGGATKTISALAYSFVQLLSYTSSCTNPITYCFMNKKYREAFMAACACQRRNISEARTQLQGEAASYARQSVRNAA
ncbi:PREDICTED: cholecystokinin receptor-like, partial [Priapulus caudatus]|uniref:Cholecystokinin receptor-like n=1 Tax=Priapulus caudatus TaxID=37621 RepID=A0ABM1EY47_PRICU